METRAERTIENQLHTYKQELTAELGTILNYWMANTVDEQHGGFYGKNVINTPADGLRSAASVNTINSIINKNKSLLAVQ